ncbi:hypothetical protein [Acidovorax carolinensis]|nr:hypothetical protein [Acidovorax carolinensis]
MNEPAKKPPLTTAADLSPLAIERLGQGVDIFMPCSPDCDGWTPPAWAKIRMDLPLLNLILLASKQVAEDGFNRISIGDTGVSADESIPDLEGCYCSWEIYVESSVFYLLGYYQDATVCNMQCPPCSISALAATLSSPRQNNITKDGENRTSPYTWHGFALVEGESLAEKSPYGNSFLDVLGEHFPEMIAQESHIKMADVIKECLPAQGAAQAAATPPKTRMLRA